MPDRADQARSLVFEIIEDLGMDVYHLYPDSRHFIGETQLVAIAVACIAGYCKGLFNLEVLGTKSREYLLGLRKQLEAREAHTEPVRIEPVIELLDAAQPSPNAVGLESLKQAMVQFGMSKELADEHAANVAALIEAHINKKN